MDPIPLLQELVAVNSINPSIVPGAPGEKEAAEVVKKAMKTIGMDVVIQEVLPGRSNVIGVLEGKKKGPSMMFCGHLDTVGVEGMEQPFTPTIKNGRLYGRGSQDMKGGVAAMIAAAGLLAGNWEQGRLIVAAVVDEEYESLGAKALIKKWKSDFAIITEPTDLAVACGHRGFAWLEVIAHGRAAHGSRPKEGRDAILRMGRILTALESLDKELQSRPPNGIQGTGSLHASLINGGRELSTYPDLCTLQMERRTLSGEDDAAILEEVQTILQNLQKLDPEFRAEARVTASQPAYLLDSLHPLPQEVQKAAANLGHPGSPIGMTFWTDAAILAKAGIPSVLFGPGGAGLHSTVEYVNIEDVLTCRDVLAKATLSLCANIH